MADLAAPQAPATAAPAPLPTGDDFFGKEAPPSADQFFGQESRAQWTGGAPVMSDEAQDAYIAQNPLGKILDAAGQGAKDNWGAGPLGLSPESEKALRDAGIFNDYASSHTSFYKSVNEAFMRPAARVIDVIGRTGSAAFGAYQAGVAELGTQIGQPELGRALAAIPEAEFGSPGHLHAPKPGGMFERPSVLPAIGLTEEAWKAGDAIADAPKPAVAEPAGTPRPAVNEAAVTAAAPLAEEAPPAAAPDVHALAREAAPEVFNGPTGYDALSQQRDTFRRWLDELGQTRDDGHAAAPPNGEAITAIDQQISGITDKVGGVEDRLTKTQAAKLDDLRSQRGNLADEADSITGKDTPDMARIRAELQATDVKMRDMAPDVSAAYRKAQEQMPPEIAAEAPPLTAETPPAETAPGEPVTAEATPAPATEAPTVMPIGATEGAPKATEPSAPVAPVEKTGAGINIAADVTKKLTAAGRPVEEAQAGAALIEAHYEARAARFGGAKGTAAEMYARDAPTIRAGRGGTRAKAAELELAQKGDAVKTIKGDEIAPPTADLKTLRAAARQFYEKTLRGTVVRSEALGKDVEFRSSDKAFSASANPDKLRLFAALPEIVAKGRLISSEPPRNPAIERSTKAYHYLEAPVEMGGVEHTVGVTIREDTTGHLYYNHSPIEKGRDRPGATEVPPSKDGPGSTGGGTTLNQKIVTPTDDVNLAVGPSQSRGGKRGSIKITGGRNVITLMRDANASTFIHETGHQWLEEMVSDAADPQAPAELKADAAAVHSWLGTSEGSPIPTAAHERFARGFETYMREGVAPSQRLAGVFGKFKAWLTKIYDTAAKLRSPISADIRGVFDRLLATKDERTVIAPEREPAATFADMHEADAATTLPKHADAVGDIVRDEAAAVAEQHVPEHVDAINRGVAAEARGRPNQSQEPDGSGARAGSPAGQTGNAQAPGTLGPGGGEVAADGAGARAKPGLIPPKIPPAPLSLVDFLKKNGGLADDTYSKRVNTAAGRADAAANPSDLRSMDAHLVRGLIRAKNGLSLELAAEKAEEAGYLPGIVGKAGRNDLLDALREELGGKKRYSENDAAKLQEHLAALQKNAEFDEAAHRLGIDTTGKTRPEVFDEMADRMSVEAQGKFANDQADAHETALAEAEAAAEAARGDSWEQDMAHDVGAPRTLEELEDAYRQEETAGRPGEGAGDAGERSAGPRQGAGEDGAGSREYGAGDGRRDDPAAAGGNAADRPVGPDAALPAGDTRLVDKAGNIRLENLNTTDDARALVRELAAKNMDFNDARYSDASYQLHNQIIAAGEMLSAAAEDAVKAQAKWQQSGAEADAVAYALATQRALIAANVRAEITAGWGRAGNAFKKQVDQIRKAESVVDYIKRSTGKTLGELDEEGRLLNQLDSPDAKAKFLSDSRATTWQKTRAGFLAYFINNLISGPITHISYGIGNEFFHLFKAIPVTAAKATAGAIEEAFAGKPIDRVYYGEIGAQLWGSYRGARDGIAAAGKALDSGVPYMKGAMLQEGLALGDEAFRPQAIPGKLGRVLETPSRAVSAIHTFFYATNYESEIASQAYRAATKAGLEGDAFTQAIARFVANPPAEVIAAAHDEALSMVLMRKPAFESFQSKLSSAINSNVFAKVVMPFMQIGSNILREGLIEHTPLAFLTQDARDNLAGRNGAVARQTEYGKIGTGVAVMTTVVGLTAEGILTDGGPTDPTQRRLWEASGKVPYSIKIGNYYVPYRKYLGPVGPMVATASNLYSVGHLLNDGQITQAAGTAMFGTVDVVANETWMKGLSNFTNAAKHWDTDGEKYLSNLAVDMIPFAVGVGQATRMIDPQRHEVHSMLDSFRAHLPGLSQGLYPVRSPITGEPVATSRLGMLGASETVSDPVLAALTRTNKFPTQPERSILGVPLTEKQHDDLANYSGHLTMLRLQQAGVGSPEFAGMELGEQEKIITKTIDKARATAQTIVKMESVGTDNDIPSKYALARAAGVEGGKDAKKAILTGQPAPERISP